MQYFLKSRPKCTLSQNHRITESLTHKACWSPAEGGDDKLLSDDQFGFCTGRSCTTQLLVTINDWLSELDNNIPVDAAYLDLCKAFDTVPHQRLIRKLEGYGVGGKLKAWVEDFLTDRSQYVTINGNNSDSIKVSSGVPQGSVLGPTLFIWP